MRVVAVLPLQARVATIQDHIEDAITDFYLKNPNEKDLKAVMTSKGHITIKSAKKTEKTSQKTEALKEVN